MVLVIRLFFKVYSIYLCLKLEYIFFRKNNKDINIYWFKERNVSNDKWGGDGDGG